MTAFLVVLSILFNSQVSDICRICSVLENMAAWSLWTQNHHSSWESKDHLPQVSCSPSTFLSNQVNIFLIFLSCLRPIVPPIDRYRKWFTSDFSWFPFCQRFVPIVWALSYQASLITHCWAKSTVQPLTSTYPHGCFKSFSLLICRKSYSWTKILIVVNNFKYGASDACIWRGDPYILKWSDLY